MSLQTSDGHYFVEEQNQELWANRTSIGQWETFTMVDINQDNRISDGDVVNFIGWTGHYWTAEFGGGDTVNVNRTHASVWEEFTLIKVGGSSGSEIRSGDRVALRTYDDVHFTVAEDAHNRVNADRVSIGEWETFTIWFH